MSLFNKLNKRYDIIVKLCLNNEVRSFTFLMRGVSFKETIFFNYSSVYSRIKEFLNINGKNKNLYITSRSYVLPFKILFESPKPYPFISLSLQGNMVPLINLKERLKNFFTIKNLFKNSQKNMNN